MCVVLLFGNHRLGLLLGPPPQSKKCVIRNVVSMVFGMKHLRKFKRNGSAKSRGQSWHFHHWVPSPSKKKVCSCRRIARILYAELQPIYGRRFLKKQMSRRCTSNGTTVCHQVKPHWHRLSRDRFGTGEILGAKNMAGGCLIYMNAKNTIPHDYSQSADAWA